MRQVTLWVVPLLFIACATTEPLPASAAAPRAATTVADGPDSIWDYLSAKYDADGDGRVVSAEYDRGQQTFARLDRDDDGQLSASDFAADDHGAGPSPERMAPMLLVRGFQTDDDMALGRDELRRALAALDGDGDGRLSASESAPAFASLRAMMDMDFHAMLASAADEDGDGALSEVELLAVFDRADSDGDGALRPMMGGGHGPGPRRGSEATAVAEPEGDPPPAAEGRLAPDFALRPVSGDGDPVRLSSFRGERPVALIFGSYT